MRLFHHTVNVIVLLLPASVLLTPERAMSANVEAADRPFAYRELAGWMRVLAKPDSSIELSRMLRELDQRAPRSEPKLAAALLSAAEKVDHYFRKQQLRQLASKFDHSLKQVVQDLNEYAGSGPVSRVGPPVPIHATLAKGTVLALKRNDADLFDPVHVVGGGESSDVVFYTRGLSKVVRSAAKDDLNYAPETIPQPDSFFRTPIEYEAASPFEEVRTWSDKTGRFQVEAKLVAIGADQVRLRKADGREIEVPVHRLSLIDADYVRMRHDLAENLMPQ